MGLVGSLLLVTFIGLPLAGGQTAHAHTGTQSYVYLEVFDDAIFGRVEYPIGDLNRLLGYDIANERRVMRRITVAGNSADW